MKKIIKSTLCNTETAKLLGCTQVGVSRRERKILEELREKLT